MEIEGVIDTVLFDHGITVTNFTPDEPFEPRGPVLVELDDLEDFNNQRTEVILDTIESEDWDDHVRLANVAEVTVVNSVFDNWSDDAIEVRIFDLDPTDPNYDYEFDTNIFDDDSILNAATVFNDAISIISTAGGDNGAFLDLEVTNNIFDLGVGNLGLFFDASEPAALRVDFDGSTEILVADNEASVGTIRNFDDDFDFFNPPDGLITLQVGDDNDGNTTDILIDSNILTQNFSGASTILVEMGGPGSLEINNNILEQRSQDGVLLELAYDAGGTVTQITSNIFNQADGGVAILVDDATPITAINIGNNIFNLADGAGLFQNPLDPEVILSADGPIVLSGTGNIANGTNILPVDPASFGNITGGFTINGTVFP